MVKFQELIPLLVIFIALISLSRCGSFVTVTEDEAVQLEFPYPCDSNKVTIQSANRLPFYDSEEPESLILPSYQLQRFSVTDENCSVQVDINPVKRSDEATYICQAYRDGAIQSELTRIRLNVHYPPGDASCTFSINDDAADDWVPLQCTAPAGSLAGGIYCYQDSKRLPPQSNLIKTGTKLEQTIWARKEYPVFCCSSILDRPKDVCGCNDFVWDPSDTEVVLNPCHVTTAGQGEITKDPVEKSGDHLFTDTVNPSTSNTYTGTNNEKSSPLLWLSGIAILILVTALVIVTLYLCHVKKTNKKSLTEKEEEQRFMLKVQECSPEHQKSNSFNSLENEKARSMSRGHHFINNIILCNDIEYPKQISLTANSMETKA